MLLPVRVLGLLAATMIIIGGCCVNRVHCAGGACDPIGPGPAAIGACGDCGGGCCGTLTSLIGHTLTCGSGCGEVYYGEWISDPPDCCDPCDNCGNWVGPQHCCRPFSFLNPCNWFGIRYYDDCGGCGACSLCLPACDGCGAAGCDSCGPPAGEYIETIDQPQPALPTPPPMPATAKSHANKRPYYTRSAGSHSVVR